MSWKRDSFLLSSQKLGHKAVMRGDFSLSCARCQESQIRLNSSCGLSNHMEWKSSDGRKKFERLKHVHDWLAKLKLWNQRDFTVMFDRRRKRRVSQDRSGCSGATINQYAFKHLVTHSTSHYIFSGFMERMNWSTCKISQILRCFLGNIAAPHPVQDQGIATYTFVFLMVFVQLSEAVVVKLTILLLRQPI